MLPAGLAQRRHSAFTRTRRRPPPKTQIRNRERHNGSADHKLGRNEVPLASPRSSHPGRPPGWWRPDSACFTRIERPPSVLASREPTIATHAAARNRSGSPARNSSCGANFCSCSSKGQSRLWVGNRLPPIRRYGATTGMDGEGRASKRHLATAVAAPEAMRRAPSVALGRGHGCGSAAPRWAGKRAGTHVRPRTHRVSTSGHHLPAAGSWQRQSLPLVGSAGSCPQRAHRSRGTVSVMPDRARL